MDMPPATTAMGAIIAHITGGADSETFQPMNVNFGLFPDIETKERGREKKKALSQRALFDLGKWLEHFSSSLPPHPASANSLRS
jgi:methylenetetrahydrofolate--tRNA-(uracil-5-)-methyltransferase